jgi:ribosomal protein S18 acetylase RimI-like enzyme
MRTEFRSVDARREMRSLLEFDRKVFRAADRFDREYWRVLDSHWMLVGGVKAGCCAFQHHVDFQEDLRDDGFNPRLEGSLFIATTGILPRFQGQGLGRLLKAWEIAFAYRHGFHRIVTNTRQRNAAMIGLNQAFGFRIVRTTPSYYDGPRDGVVVMELGLKRR